VDEPPEPPRRLPRRIFILRHGESQARALRCDMRCAAAHTRMFC
jgi:hypothetical protein